MHAEQPTSDQQLRADIERLRAEFTDTQDLYREVCVLLFFRHGIAPTANKLYQLVRKGSMNAPAQALATFWEQLREKSRIRIEHPDLPEELKTAAGELTAALWSKAQHIAQASLSSFQAEAQATVVESKAATASAEARAAQVANDLNVAQDDARQKAEQVAQLQQQLATASANGASLSAQLDGARHDQSLLKVELANARRDFASELAKLRDSVKLADDQFQAAERRALLEIDRERTAAKQLRKDLDQSQTLRNKNDEQHRKDTAALQLELAGARQRLGQLEGGLSESKTQNGVLAKQLAEVRRELSVAVSDAARARGESTMLQERLAKAAARPIPKVRAIRLKRAKA